MTLPTAMVLSMGIICVTILIVFFCEKHDDWRRGFQQGVDEERERKK